MQHRLRKPDSAEIEPVPLLRLGRNCWRVEQATRARLLSNSHYFPALARSLERAQEPAASAERRDEPRVEGPRNGFQRRPYPVLLR